MVDGVLVNNPVQVEGKKIHYGNLRTEKEFEDFNLKLELNYPCLYMESPISSTVIPVQVQEKSFCFFLVSTNFI